MKKYNYTEKEMELILKTIGQKTFEKYCTENRYLASNGQLITPMLATKLKIEADKKLEDFLKINSTK